MWGPGHGMFSNAARRLELPLRPLSLNRSRARGFQLSSMYFDRKRFCKMARLLPVVCAILLASSCSKKPNDAKPARGPALIPVDVAPVQTIKMDRTLPVVGTLFAKDEATIGAEVEGRIEKTLVEFGDRVKAQQELALIDTSLYEALARQ